MQFYKCFWVKWQIVKSTYLSPFYFITMKANICSSFSRRCNAFKALRNWLIFESKSLIINVMKLAVGNKRQIFFAKTGQFVRFFPCFSEFQTAKTGLFWNKKSWKIVITETTKTTNDLQVLTAQNSALESNLDIIVWEF